MNNGRGTLWVLGAALFVALSCGESTPGVDGSPDVADPPDPAVVAFLRARAQGSCDFGFRCGYTGENDTVRCLDRYADVEPSRELQSALREGRTVFDQESADECLRLQAVSCFFGEPGVCRAVFRGTVEPSGICASSKTSECAGDAYCRFESDAPGALGRCTPRKAPGESCASSFECGAEGSAVAQCYEGANERRCFASPALPDRDEGHVCGTWLEEGELMQAGCSPPFGCLGGLCAPRLPDGAECEPVEGRCRGGSNCAGICIPMVVVYEVGAPCGVGDVIDLDCDARTLACVDDICQPKGDGNLGSACDFLQGPDTCNKGFACTESGHCIE